MVEQLLDAIREVETGGHPDPANAVGDDGRSRGPYQISRAYWRDVLRHNPLCPYEYDDCVGDDGVCRLIIVLYWRRYAPRALDRVWAGDGSAIKTLARLHNGGPGYATKPATIDYWRRVHDVLQTRNPRFREQKSEP